MKTILITYKPLRGAAHGQMPMMAHNYAVPRQNLN